MLFVNVYKDKGNTTEASEKRSLQLFANWKLPAGFEIKSHYAFADGTGGVLIVEAATAAALAEAAGPWGPFYDFDIHPILDIAESVPIGQRVQAWRDSVK
jgi:hypothetical protein